jgi:integrase
LRRPRQTNDDRVRNYRAHGLRKAALYTLYKAGGTFAELQALGGHSSISEAQRAVVERLRPAAMNREPTPEEAVERKKRDKLAAEAWERCRLKF